MVSVPVVAASWLKSDIRHAHIVGLVRVKKALSNEILGISGIWLTYSKVVSSSRDVTLLIALLTSLN